MCFRKIPMHFLDIVLVLGLTAGNVFSDMPKKSVYPQADVVLIRELFESRKFSEVTDLLEKYQASCEKDIRGEYAVDQAFRVFDAPSPSYKSLLDAWVSAFPKRWEPFLARASYYNARGWKARGTAWAKETSDEQFRGMMDNLILAAKDAEAAIKINPRLPHAYVVLMQVNLCRGDQKVGYLLLRKALEECPDSFLIRQQHMNLLTPRWGGSYDAMMQFALESAGVGKNPDNKRLQGMVYWDMGKVAENENKTERAIDLYKKALTFGESYTVLWYLANALLDARNPESALEALERAITLHTNLPQAYGTRSKIFLSMGKWDEALRDLEKMKLFGGKENDKFIETRKWEGNRIVEQGHSHFNMRLFTQAIEKYSLALRFDPENAEAYCWRGRVFDWTGNDGAEADLRNAISLNPHLIDAYVGLDQLLFKKRRLDEILELWNRYIELEPGIAKAYLERSGTYYHKKDLAAAYRDVKRACELGNNEGCSRMQGLKAGPLRDKFEGIDREAAAAGDGSTPPKDPGIPVKIRATSGKWYYRDAQGKSITTEEFEDAWDFKDGYARVKQNGKWGFLDVKGNFAILPQYEYCWDFSGDEAKVRLEDGSTHYIDRKGKRKTE